MVCNKVQIYGKEFLAPHPTPKLEDPSLLKELPEEWKELVIVPINKKGDKTNCRNYRGVSFLPTTYKILSKILF